MKAATAAADFTLLGAVNVTVSGNFLSGNGDGILISDDTTKAATIASLITSPPTTRPSAASCLPPIRLRVPSLLFTLPTTGFATIPSPKTFLLRTA